MTDEIKMLHDVEVDGNIYADNITDMDARITALEQGGGGGSAPINNLMFIDYDGSVVKSYSASQAAALTALPAGPTHDGMTFQAWNWTLAEITALFSASSTAHVTVGAMYTSTTTATEIELDLKRTDQLTVYLYHIAINGTITVDWGDNTAIGTYTGTSLTTRKTDITHTYSSIGQYTISITATSGSWTFYSAGTGEPFLWHLPTTVPVTLPYLPLKDVVKRISIGTDCGMTRLGNNSLNHLVGARVILSSAITTIGDSVLCTRCIDITVAMPSSVTVIGNDFGQSIGKVCVFPNGVTLGRYATSISEYICMPRSLSYSGGTSFILMSTCSKVRVKFYPTGFRPGTGSYPFGSSSSLTEYMTLPDNTSATAGSSSVYPFYGSNLKGITVVATAAVLFGSTSYMTYQAGYLRYIDLSNLTTVPTMGNTSDPFYYSPLCYIIVADNMYNSFITATNWSNTKVVWRIIKKSEVSQYIY